MIRKLVGVTVAAVILAHWIDEWIEASTAKAVRSAFSR